MNIRGERLDGGERIAEGQQAIFDSIYRGSRIEMRVASSRALGSDVVLAHVQTALEAPSGPMAGRNASAMILVLHQAADRWEVVAAHNTLVAPPRP